MQIKVLFQASQFLHIPVETNNWPAISFPVDMNVKVEIGPLVKPSKRTAHVHSVPGKRKGPVVVDASFPVFCTTDIDKTKEDYLKVRSIAYQKAKSFAEWLRVKSNQPQLRLSNEYNLECRAVYDSTDHPLPNWGRDFRRWSKNPHERPLPLVNQEAWHSAIKDTQDKVELPLHKVLLLDAEAELERDPRTAILFADMACEVFIQRYTEAKAKAAGIQDIFWKWLVDNPFPEGRRPSTPAYYNAILALVMRVSLKDENGELFGRLRKLVDARNDIAHRGILPLRTPPEKLVETAREVIKWVEDIK